MGRVKLQIKRIENTTNRQVTFSKRRNGLIKKAYELSVLCDVDVALIMFSPSGRVSLFSGNKSIEEILARYANLPDHERGRMHNQEFLQRAINKLRSEADSNCQTTSPASSDSQIEEIQQEIVCFKTQIEEMENQLRLFEGDQSEVTNLNEAEYREHILEETLKNVIMRKQVLEKYNSYDAAQFTTQIQLPLESQTANIDELDAARPQNIIDWLPPRDPHIHMLTFFDANGFLRVRDDVQRGISMLPPNASTLQGQDMNGINTVDYEHINPTTGFVNDDNNTNIINNNYTATALLQPTSQLLDVNLMSPWTHLYSTGDESFHRDEEPSGRELRGLYMSDQYAALGTSTLSHNQNP